MSKVYLFGHYDSRGGTAAVDAGSREEAIDKYVYSMWPYSVGDDERVEAFKAGEDDLIGEFELEDAPDNDAGMMDIDGAECGEGKIGLVITDAKSFHDDATGARLRYITMDSADYDKWCDEEMETDNRPVPGHPGWFHPRWDDDAYSFLYIV